MNHIALLLLLLLGFSVINHSQGRPGEKEALERRNTWRKAQEEKLLLTKQKDFSNQRHTELHETNPQDKLALQRFYTSTNGPQWANNSGWMKGDPCMDYWYGIYCSDSGRILQINLVFNLLSGSIPVDIALLDELQVLRLYSNNIGGTLPSGIFSLNSLQIIDLDNNQIGGSLPSVVKMMNITTINLYGNKLTGNLPNEWHTPNLQVISISSNMLEGHLPQGIGKITSLTQLVLSNNMLTGTFPTEYNQLTNLQQLWLFSNKFDKPSLPASWSAMTSLSNVQIDQLFGEFPDFIGKSWQNIELLVLVDGHLSGPFPTSLCDFKKIQYLHIFNNSLTGDLPDCICDLPRTLVSLELSDNQITGEIPQCIGNLNNLTNFYLSRNNISSTLPTSLGNLKRLEIMDFSSNGIYGAIPSTFSNLVGYTVQLGLCYNKLSSVENGLEAFFDFVKDYSCLLYDNPWNCPLPSFVPKECEASCSPCNSGSTHNSCTACIAKDGCGWCNEGRNCLPGSSAQGPDDYYPCEMSHWTFGSQGKCPN